MKAGPGRAQPEISLVADNEGSRPLSKQSVRPRDATGVYSPTASGDVVISCEPLCDSSTSCRNNIKAKVTVAMSLKCQEHLSSSMPKARDTLYETLQELVFFTSTRCINDVRMQSGTT